MGGVRPKLEFGIGQSILRKQVKYIPIVQARDGMKLFVDKGTYPVAKLLREV